MSFIKHGGSMRINEYERIHAMLSYERAARDSGFSLIAGIDEVGRGPLAGPVVSAAVILPEDYYPEGLNDSKKLSPKTREKLFYRITRDAVAWGVGVCDSQEIDRINILNATIKSMELALSVISPEPDYLLIDAVSLKKIKIAQNPIIKGDELSLSIAAASVVAKVIRDRMMSLYDRIYPDYGFIRHKGYGTKEHIEIISKKGLCPIHRSTFCKNIPIAHILENQSDR